MHLRDGQKKGPGLIYEIQINGSPEQKTGTSLMDTIPSSSKLDDLNSDPSRDPLRDQPQAIVFEMYVPIGYPSKKLEFFIKDVFNVTEYQSTKVLDKINAQAF